MKTFRYALLSLAVLGATGCATLDALRKPFVTEERVSAVTLSVPGSTNVVTQDIPAQTNAVTDAVGNVTVLVTPAYRTNFITLTGPSEVTRFVTNTVTTVNPALVSSLTSAQSLNASLNPTPSAPIINVLLTALLGGLGFFARLKTKQATESQGLLRTVIAGVEEARSPETKQAIAKFSEAVGNAPQLDALVRKLTH